MFTHKQLSMKLFSNITTFHSTKSLLNRTALTLCNSYKFCTATEQKTQENSDDDNSTSNPLVQTLSETELFQTVSGPASSGAQHNEGYIESIRWEKENRKRPTVNESNHYSRLLNASTVDEIRNELQIFKDKYTQNKQQHTLNLMDNIMDSTSSSNPDKTDTKPKNYKYILSEAYCKALAAASYLKQFDEGFKIFEEAKQNKSVLSPNIFASAIQLQMEQDFSRKSLDKCFNIRYEMEEKYKMRPTAKVYQQLISNALDLKEIHRAGGMVKIIMKLEESEKQRMLTDFTAGKFLRIAIIRYYSKRKQIRNGLEFMNYLVKTFGKKVINDHIYSSMLSGIAQKVNDGDKDMVEAGEKLWMQSFDILDRAPTENVFLSLMNMYSYVPDYKSCIDMLHTMLSKDDWPKPTSFSCSVCLKAINKYGRYKQDAKESNELQGEHGWKHVEDILELMRSNNIKPHTAIFSLLFNLCSGMFNGEPDLERLYKYYDDMMDNQMSLNPSGAHNLLLAGVDYYAYEIKNNAQEKEKFQEECMKFVDWALAQYKRHNITLIGYHQRNLEQKLNDINKL